MGLDAYQQWLKIPPERQPPTYYDLLGLPVDESDLERIDQTAKDRYSHVLKYAGGTDGKIANDILDEISQALRCLTNPLQRKEYDRKRIAAKVGEWFTASRMPRDFYELLDCPVFSPNGAWLLSAIEMAKEALKSRDPASGAENNCRWRLGEMLRAAEAALRNRAAFKQIARDVFRRLQTDCTQEHGSNQKSWAFNRVQEWVGRQGIHPRYRKLVAKRLCAADKASMNRLLQELFPGAEVKDSKKVEETFGDLLWKEVLSSIDNQKKRGKVRTTDSEIYDLAESLGEPQQPPELPLEEKPRETATEEVGDSEEPLPRRGLRRLWQWIFQLPPVVIFQMPINPVVGCTGIVAVALVCWLFLIPLFTSRLSEEESLSVTEASSSSPLPPAPPISSAPSTSPIGIGPWKGVLIDLIARRGETHMLIDLSSPVNGNKGIEAYTRKYDFVDQVIDYRCLRLCTEPDVVSVQGEAASEEDCPRWRLITDRTPLIRLTRLERPGESDSVVNVGGPPRKRFRQEEEEVTDFARLLMCPPSSGIVKFTCYVPDVLISPLLYNRYSNGYMVSPSRSNLFRPVAIIDNISQSRRNHYPYTLPGAKLQISATISQDETSPYPKITVLGLRVLNAQRTTHASLPPRRSGANDRRVDTTMPPSPSREEPLPDFAETMKQLHEIVINPSSRLGRTIRMSGNYDHHSSGNDGNYVTIDHLFFRSASSPLLVEYSPNPQGSAMLDHLKQGEKILFGVRVVKREEAFHPSGSRSRTSRGSSRPSGTPRLNFTLAWIARLSEPDKRVSFSIPESPSASAPEVPLPDFTEAMEQWDQVKKDPLKMLGRTIQMGGYFRYHLSLNHRDVVVVTNLFFRSDPSPLTMFYDPNPEGSALLGSLKRREKVLFGVTVTEPSDAPKPSNSRSRVPRGISSHSGRLPFDFTLVWMARLAEPDKKVTFLVDQVAQPSKPAGEQDIKRPRKYYAIAVLGKTEMLYSEVLISTEFLARNKLDAMFKSLKSKAYESSKIYSYRKNEMPQKKRLAITDTLEEAEAEIAKWKKDLLRGR
ncbi:MAG: hypothetical protein JXB10_04095 [Pirellulales bacterium]|nr:hypothetical protein [Pirellulales bacterium]